MVKSFTMSPPLRSVVTLKAVAAKARVSLATVSYALRNHAKISEETRDHVLQVAKVLGYRPNPRVASLMAHIRGAHSRAFGERIAYVWVHTSRQEAAQDPFLQNVFQGAKARAQQAGFALDEFWTNDPGMSAKRLQQVITSRGIVGIVLSPVVTEEVTLTLDWDWSAFAPAVIGNVTWTPELHHAGHHHYLAMRMTLTELAKLGANRPAALIEAESNERAKRAWEGAFLTHYGPRAKAQANLRVIRATDLPDLAAWIEARKPDSVILSASQILEAPGLRKLCKKLGLPVTTLYWGNESEGIGGIDQCYQQIAAHAVDLVIAQLNSNETGVPDQPRMMLFPGVWIPPKVPEVRPARRAS